MSELSFPLSAFASASITLALLGGCGGGDKNEGRPLPEAIKTVMAKPLYRNAVWGLRVVDLATGEVIYSVDPNRNLLIASVRKSFSVGMTLDTLGAHHSGGAKLLWVKQGVRGKAYRESEQAPLSDEELKGFRRRIEHVAALMAASSFAGAVDFDAWGSASAAGMLHRVRAVSSDDGRDAGAAAAAAELHSALEDAGEQP